MKNAKKLHQVFSSIFQEKIQSNSIHTLINLLEVDDSFDTDCIPENLLDIKFVLEVAMDKPDMFE